jgi:hypothetical protein
MADKLFSRTDIRSIDFDESGPGHQIGSRDASCPYRQTAN